MSPQPLPENPRGGLIEKTKACIDKTDVLRIGFRTPCALPASDPAQRAKGHQPGAAPHTAQLKLAGAKAIRDWMEANSSLSGVFEAPVGVSFKTPPSDIVSQLRGTPASSRGSWR